MLDVHILVLKDRPKALVDQCISSVREAASLAGYPVGIHVLDGINGHIGKGRAKGYAIGHHPYVTYVDDDDYVLPNAFLQMHAGLLGNFRAVFTPEIQLQNGKRTLGPAHHHLIAYRREAIIDHSAYVVCGDLAQMRDAEKSENTLDLPEAAYVHRLYESPGRVLRREHHDELRTSRV